MDSEGVRPSSLWREGSEAGREQPCHAATRLRGLGPRPETLGVGSVGLARSAAWRSSSASPIRSPRSSARSPPSSRPTAPTSRSSSVFPADLLPPRRRRRHARRSLRAAPGVLSENVIIAAGLLASSFAQSMTAIYVAWGGGLGIGIGLVYAPSIASVPPWFVRRRAFAAGIASAGTGVGTLAIPLVATASGIGGARGWRHALQALAAGVLVAGGAATLLLRRAPRRAAPGTAAAGMTLMEALRSRRFWWMYAACVLAAPAMFIPFAHVSAAARDLGIGDARAVALGRPGSASAASSAASPSAASPTASAESRASPRFEASLGACYLLWLGAGGYPALAIFALWLGLSYGGIVSLMPAICMDLFGTVPSRASSARSTPAPPSATSSARSSPAPSSIAPAARYAPVIWNASSCRPSPLPLLPNSCATPARSTERDSEGVRPSLPEERSEAGREQSCQAWAPAGRCPASVVSYKFIELIEEGRIDRVPYAHDEATMRGSPRQNWC